MQIQITLAEVPKHEVVVLKFYLPRNARIFPNRNQIGRLALMLDLLSKKLTTLTFSPHFTTICGNLYYMTHRLNYRDIIGYLRSRDIKKKFPLHGNCILL